MITPPIITALRTARPNFLLLAPVCVLLGLGVAAQGQAPLDGLSAFIALIGAAFAHVSVNVLNEYEDFRSGLDLRTSRTPFSGGTGTLVAHPHLANQVQALGLASLGFTALCGLFLLVRVGWGLLPIGILGLGLIYFYSSRINYSHWLCLIAPGLGFGPLMVLGTYYATTSTWSASAVVASLIPFFLVNNLLLLNQFPDLEPDRSVGRDTLPIALGLAGALQVYGLLALLAFVSLGLGVAGGFLPPGALLGLVGMPAALVVYLAVRRLLGQGGSLIPALLAPMGINVALTLVTPLLMALGMWLWPEMGYVRV